MVTLPDPETAAGPEAAPKPRLLLCGHTYAAWVNRAKATALGEWFEVMVCAPDFEGVLVFGRDGSLQDREDQDATYQYRKLRRWPRNTGFLQCILRGLGTDFRRWQPDYVLCEAEPWSVLRWQAWALSRLQPKRPVFVEFTWENVPRPGLKGTVLRWIYRAAAKTTQGVVAGNLGAENLLRAAGLPASRILRTGQLGVDPAEHPVAGPDQKRQWRERHGFSDDAFVVGFCGRFLTEKGVLDLWEAVTLLRRTDPRLELALLGSGVLEPELRRRMAGETWCRILAPVPHEQVAGEIGCFDLMVLPSKPQLDPAAGELWEEQFGHVLLEAMLCRVPALGSSCGAIPEVLENPEVIFPAGDIPALVKLLQRWMEDPAALAQLAEAQQTRTAALWSHPSLARRYKEFLFSLTPP